MQLVYFVTVLLVDLSVAIVQMTVSVTITYFRSFCSTYAGDSFCRGYVGYNFHCNYADGSLLQLFRWFFLQCVMRMTVAIMLIYKELFKNTKMSKMLLSIGFVNTEVKNLWWLKKVNESLHWGKNTTNCPKSVTIFTSNFWKLIVIHDSRWLNSRPDVSIVIMEVAISVIATRWQFQVTTLYSFLKLISIFHEIYQKTFKTLYQDCISPFL